MPSYGIWVNRHLLYLAIASLHTAVLLHESYSEFDTQPLWIFVTSYYDIFILQEKEGISSLEFGKSEIPPLPSARPMQMKTAESTAPSVVADDREKSWRDVSQVLWGRCCRKLVSIIFWIAKIMLQHWQNKPITITHLGRVFMLIKMMSTVAPVRLPSFLHLHGSSWICPIVQDCDRYNTNSVMLEHV